MDMISQVKKNINPMASVAMKSGAPLTCEYIDGSDPRRPPDVRTEVSVALLPITPKFGAIFSPKHPKCTWFW